MACAIMDAACCVIAIERCCLAMESSISAQMKLRVHARLIGLNFRISLTSTILDSSCVYDTATAALLSRIPKNRQSESISTGCHKK